MKTSTTLFFYCLLVFFGLKTCELNSQTFSATGYTSLENIPSNDWGGTEVTFDKVPGAKLVIDGMGHALWQPSDIRVNFGYLETFDPDRANGDVLISWETIGDEAEKLYNRVWVESQNAARIKVVFIGGLIYLENNDTYGRRIAHSSFWSGSPWGPQYMTSHPDPEATGFGYGDWAEEVYYIYPDGSHTRYAKCYSAFAHLAVAFDSSRLPEEGDYQFEFNEVAFQIPEGDLPNTVVNPNAAVLLADMAGNHTQIAYEPENPGLNDVSNGFGSLRYGNMMAIDVLNTDHNPFVIGLPNNPSIPEDNTEMRPYECFLDDGQDCSTFYMWGAPCTYGCVSPLGHLVNWEQYEKQQANQATNTPGFVSNVYLQGWISDQTTGSEFSQLGRSWITPANMNITSSGFVGGDYEVTERAYKVTKTTGTDFTCTLQGSSTNPLRNPAIVIENWGTSPANVTVNGASLPDTRIGYEGNDIVVWMEYSSETAANIIITAQSTDPNSNLVPFGYCIAVEDGPIVDMGNVILDPDNTDSLYNEGTIVTATAVPSSGWSFSNWSGLVSSTANPIAVTVEKTRIACVGNSITEGALLSNPSTESYPGQLQTMLGAAYDVQNFGYSGATLSNNSSIPYMSQQNYTDALNSQPDIVTIMLGTNDTFDWATRGLDFQNNLTNMIQAFQALPSNPQVILCIPPAMQGEAFNDRNAVLANNITAIINSVGQSMGLGLVDMFTPTLNQPTWFPDGVHPNVTGAGTLAGILEESLPVLPCLTANFVENLIVNNPPTPTNNGTFPAYYTRTNFNEHTTQISGEYADVVVKVGDIGDLVFSREHSFRPNWIYSGGNELVGHLATISGDGPADGNFDLRCRYAYARIVQNTSDQVVVHWRYFPDLSNLDPTAVVHELYFINTD
ncbi:MAG: GDSL-type esterase/lipase family protein, partial [Bacteroidota bacterium]